MPTSPSGSLLHLSQEFPVVNDWLHTQLIAAFVFATGIEHLISPEMGFWEITNDSFVTDSRQPGGNWESQGPACGLRYKPNQLHPER
jgi:hypothetical protein